ncbi:MAG: LysE family translocator [Acidimicrobiales bacterium]
MPDRIGEFLVASVILLLIPGPAVLYITARGMDQGRWAGTLSAWGVELGNLVVAVVTAFGLSAILVSSVLAFDVVKYLGAAYLIYLGIRRLLARSRAGDQVSPGRSSLRRAFVQGVVVGISNPKTALFFFAFLPQFVDPSHGRAWLQLLVLGLLFVAVGMVTDTGYALASGTVGGRLQGRRRFFPAERWIAGGTYIALGVLAAVSGTAGRLHAPAPPRP